MTDSPCDVFAKTDWQMLAKQKEALVEAADRSDKGGYLDGLLSWIDAVQDSAEGLGYPVFAKPDHDASLEEIHECAVSWITDHEGLAQAEDASARWKPAMQLARAAPGLLAALVGAVEAMERTEISDPNHEDYPILANARVAVVEAQNEPA